MAYNRLGAIVDTAVDPFASTTDSITAYYHVQSISEGGTSPNLTAPAAANYPETGVQSRYFLDTRHRIDVSDLGAARPCVIKDLTDVVTLTRVTGTPAANQYRLAPANSVRRSVIELHSGQAGHSIGYDFYSIGSVLDESAFEVINKTNYDSYSITADYTILDYDGYKIIYPTHTSGTTKMITITLPTASDNEDREIIIKQISNGITKIVGEGSEYIDGINAQYIFSNNDLLHVVATSIGWKILRHNLNYETGGFNTNDQSDRHFGNVVVTFDGGSGTFLVGEIVREYNEVGHSTATGRYGTIVAVTATTLSLMFVDGNAVFANDKYLLGMNSGASAVVNGSSKNADSPLVHLTGLKAEQFRPQIFLTGATTYDPANTYEIVGYTMQDSATLIIQTASTGISYIATDGTYTTVTALDGAFNIFLKRRI